VSNLKLLLHDKGGGLLQYLNGELAADRSSLRCTGHLSGKESNSVKHFTIHLQNITAQEIYITV
jgi:hypothetical protein